MTLPRGSAPTHDPSGYLIEAPTWTHDPALDRVLGAGRGVAVQNLAGQPGPLPDLP